MVTERQKIIAKLKDAGQVLLFKEIEKLKSVVNSDEELKRLIEELISKVEPEVKSFFISYFKSEIEKSNLIFEDNLNQLKESYTSYIESIPKPKDGSDYIITEADIEKIASLVNIEIPEVKEKTATEIRDMLESLTDDERLDFNSIKGLKEKFDSIEKMSVGQPYGNVRGGGGISLKLLSQLQDVDLSGLTIVDGKYVLGSGGSGGISDGDKGDITVSTGGTSWTIDNDAVTTNKILNHNVTLEKIQQIGTHKFLGRHTEGDGNVQQLTATDARNILNVEDGAEVNNISDANATDLTDGGNTTLHHHDSRYYTESETDTLLAGKVDASTLNETIQDQIGTKVVAGTDISVTYDYTSGNTTIAYTGTSGSGGVSIKKILTVSSLKI